MNGVSQVEAGDWSIVQTTSYFIIDANTREQFHTFIRDTQTRMDVRRDKTTRRPIERRSTTSFKNDINPTWALDGGFPDLQRTVRGATRRHIRLQVTRLHTTLCFSFSSRSSHRHFFHHDSETRQISSDAFCAHYIM